MDDVDTSSTAEARWGGGGCEVHGRSKELDSIRSTERHRVRMDREEVNRAKQRSNGSDSANVNWMARCQLDGGG